MRIITAPSQVADARSVMTETQICPQQPAISLIPRAKVIFQMFRASAKVLAEVRSRMCGKAPEDEWGTTGVRG